MIENKTYKHPLNESSCIHTSKIGSKILIFNKIEPHSKFNSEIKMFDTKHFIWKDLKTEIVNRFCFTAIEYMGMIWILGGRRDNGSDLETVNSIEVYDPILDLINPSSIKMLCSRCQHRSITYKGKLYVFGGFDGNTYLNSVEMYSPDVNKFVMMAPMKIPRCNFGCCRIKNLVYVTGSYTSMEIYNLDNNTWSDGVEFSKLILASSACAVKNKLIRNHKVQMEIVEAPNQKKTFSFFNLF